MKLNLLKYRTSRSLRSNKTFRNNLSYQQANLIGLIFSIEDKHKHDEIKDLIKRLELDGKKVKAISFLPVNKDNYEFMFDFFTGKDLSFWGSITSNSANNFAEIPFDFLLYLDTTPNPFLLNIIARSKAKCRVGKFWENAESYFELMIEIKNGNKELIDRIYQYTSSLK